MAAISKVKTTSAFRNGMCVFDVAGVHLSAHTEFVARTSDTLKDMIARQEPAKTKGSKTVLVPVIPIPDTTEGTLTRFLEFAYTGDYNPATPNPTNGRQQNGSPPAIKLEEHEASAVSDSAIIANGGSRRKYSKRNPNPKPGPVRMWQVARKSAPSLPFKKRTYEEYMAKESNSSDASEDETTITPLLKTESSLIYSMEGAFDFLPVFFSHAELHLFAVKYKIKPLENLTAIQFHEALESYSSWEKDAKNDTTDFAALVSWVYENTADSGGKIHKLRAAVLSFCAKNRRELSESDSFLKLLDKGGRFARDLFVKPEKDSDPDDDTD